MAKIKYGEIIGKTYRAPLELVVFEVLKREGYSVRLQNGNTDTILCEGYVKMPVGVDGKIVEVPSGVPIGTIKRIQNGTDIKVATQNTFEDTQSRAKFKAAMLEQFVSAGNWE